MYGSDLRVAAGARLSPGKSFQLLKFSVVKGVFSWRWSSNAGLANFSIGEEDLHVDRGLCNSFDPLVYLLTRSDHDSSARVSERWILLMN